MCFTVLIHSTIKEKEQSYLWENILRADEKKKYKEITDMVH